MMNMFERSLNSDSSSLKEIPPVNPESVESFRRQHGLNKDVLSFWNFRKNTGKGFNLLDVGAGDADFVRYLQNQENSKNFYRYDSSEEHPHSPFTENDVTAVDTSKRLVQSFAKDWYKQGSIHNLPFPDESFYYVVSNAVVPMYMHENLDYPYTTDINDGKVSIEDVIKELIRVTKPVGQIRFDMQSPDLVEEIVRMEDEASIPENLKTPEPKKKIDFIEKTEKFLESINSKDLRVRMWQNFPHPDSVYNSGPYEIVITKNPAEYDALVEDFEAAEGSVDNKYNF